MVFYLPLPFLPALPSAPPVYLKNPIETKIFYSTWYILKQLRPGFIRRISAVSNAIQTKDNEARNHLIIYCLNCIRHGRNATYEPGFSRGILSYFGYVQNYLYIEENLKISVY